MDGSSFLVFLKQIITEMLKGNFSSLLAFRYYAGWKNSLKPGSNSVVDKQPWITFPVIDLLIKTVTENTRVFEFGGGGSTLFFTNKAREVVTVEHDQKWFDTLEQLIAQGSASGWTGKLILPEKKAPGSALDPSDPAHYYTSDAAFQDFTFFNYASFIDNYPPEYFDIVLVDGRARPSCVVHSITRIKKGGMLVIDNSDRSYYFKHLEDKLQKEFELVYNSKAPSPYVNFFTRTGIWRKL